MLSKVPGWLRTRRFILVDRSVTGTLPGATEPDRPPPKFLALHDYASPDGPRDSPEFRAAISTPWRIKVHAYKTGDERRTFKVYKTFT